tara:strand:- start:359 stop:562 length:204 start_codon:yes stop_codon:yes gene_type:complete
MGRAHSFAGPGDLSRAEMKARVQPPKAGFGNRWNCDLRSVVRSGGLSRSALFFPCVDGGEPTFVGLK